MSHKKNVAKGLGASTLAAATLISGLSFGPAAIAAPAPETSTESAAPNATNGGFEAAGVGTAASLGTQATGDVTFGVKVAEQFTHTIGSTIELTAPKGTVFTAGQTTLPAQWRRSSSDAWSTNYQVQMTGTVSEDGSTFTGTAGENWIEFPVGAEIRWQASVTTGSDLTGTNDLGFTFISTTGLGSARVVGKSPVTLVARNGGLDPVGVGTASSIALGATGDVAFGVSVEQGVSWMTDRKVEATAPTGTVFTAEQSSLVGEVLIKDEWVALDTLTVDGSASDDGRTFSGQIRNTLVMPKDSQVRWHVDVTAAEDAAPGAQELGFTVNGKTNHGTASVAGSSPVALVAAEQEVAELVVSSPVSGSIVQAEAGDPDEEFPNAKVEFTGTGEPGAEIVGFRSNGKQGGSATVGDDGTWTMFMDMGWTSYPTTTVRQTAGEDVQDRVVTDLTIVQAGAELPFSVGNVVSGGTIQAPVGDPAEGFPNARVPFSGEGATGATVNVYRPNGKLAGTTRVTPEGSWALDADINWGTWDLTVEHKPTSGDAERVLLTDVTVAPEGVTQSFQVATPVSNSTVSAEAGSSDAFPNAKLVVTGTGTPGATVSAFRAHNGKQAGTTTVLQNGEWSLDADMNWGTWSLNITHTIGGATETSSVTDITIEPAK